MSVIVWLHLWDANSRLITTLKLLQNQLCEKCNIRFAKSSDDEPEEDETEEDAKKRKQHGLSKVEKPI